MLYEETWKCWANWVDCSSFVVGDGIIASCVVVGDGIIASGVVVGDGRIASGVVVGDGRLEDSCVTSNCKVSLCNVVWGVVFVVRH